MSDNIPKKEFQIFDNRLIDFNDLKTLKKKKDTAEIVRFVAQQICQNCIDECNKIKSSLMNDLT